MIDRADSFFMKTNYMMEDAADILYLLDRSNPKDFDEE